MSNKLQQLKEIVEQSASLQAENTKLKELLWDSYMILDHGSCDQRIAMLEKLEQHFNEVGRPKSRA